MSYRMVPGDHRSMQFYHVLRKRNAPGVKHLILNEGVAVNHMFADGSFPVHIAAERADVENLRFLLSMRACPDMKNRHGQTALMLGIDFVDVVQTLVIEYRCQVDLRDTQQRAALHLAGARGLLQVVRILLAGGSPVNIQDRWGRTPLHVTLLNLNQAQNTGTNYSEIVRLLLDRKSNVNQADKFHATPLFLGANSGHLEITKQLIEFGADVNKPGRHRTTPLMLAAIKGNIGVCQILIYHNCKINSSHLPSGKTCLELAIQKGFFDILKLLISAGCDLYTKNWDFHKKREQLQQRNKATPELWEWLEEVFSNPLPLQHWCRMTVRNSMGRGLLNRVAKLRYPDSLKNYILLKDIIPETVVT